MFDYKGLTEEELIKICSNDNTVRGKCDLVYWTSEVYSNDKSYRDYGFYPSFLPLYIYSDHGIASVVSKHEIENDAECMVVFSKEKAELYKKFSDKPCVVCIAPLVWYRHSRKIEQVKNAKGTIAFPAHSTMDVNVEFDEVKYIRELKALPKEMQPVCVCLHMHDINQNRHKIYLEHGIPVYTAGNAFDVRFAERYYNIIKNFKFSTSNLIGSYSYYCTEMGIPFSLFGTQCKYFNVFDPNLPKGEFNYKDFIYKRAEKLFTGLYKEVTSEQRQFVEEYLGVNDSISRVKFSSILYKAYLKRGNLLKDILNYFFVRKFKRLKNKRKFVKNVKKLYKELKSLKIKRSDVKKLLKANNEPVTTELFGTKFKANSAFWFIHGLRELFIDETYKFNSLTDDPYIIDCGANTGLSVLFFKRLYPKSKIVAFEPDSKIFEILKENISQYNLKEVKLENKAVWKNNDGINFLASGGVGGHINDNISENTIFIPTFRLKDLLDKKVDFLKIDIEGAEYEVIRDCAEKLDNVENIFIEYHSEEKNEQMLDEILKILKEAGFKYYIKEAWNNQPKPFTNERNNLYDLQLNIFGYRL